MISVKFIILVKAQIGPVINVTDFSLSFSRCGHDLEKQEKKRKKKKEKKKLALNTEQTDHRNIGKTVSSIEKLYNQIIK